MKYISFAILIIAASCQLSNADIVKIETNTWRDSSPFIWTCQLQRIDEDGVAHFIYVNRGQEIDFDIHVTRIYSLEINDAIIVNRDFPPTRQNLSTRLPTNPNSRRVIELTNQNFVEVPPMIPRRPCNGTNMCINGYIRRATLEQFDIESTIRPDNHTIPFPVQRTDLIIWIR